MLNILFSAQPAAWDEYSTPLHDAFAKAGVAVEIATDHAPETVDYIIFAPNGPVTDFTPFTRAKAVMSLWAGVETIVDNTTLTQPLTRMVDEGLTQGMVEWVTGHVLRHHLGMDQHIHGQDGIWRDDNIPPLAQDRRVTILGIGALGLACGQALHTLGFPVTGWSRTPKSSHGITCLHGNDGLDQALRTADILVLLLPLTEQTTHFVNAKRIAQMPQDAIIINPGRGPLIQDEDLLAALDQGHIAHATLDVFATEPLPKAHPFWAHPRVTVTPHIASTTRPTTAAQKIAFNIKDHEAGLPLQNRVDRKAGY